MRRERSRNCTIVNNHTAYKGGGLHASQSTRVYNTVVALNSSDNDATAYAPNVTLASGLSASCFDHCAFSGTTCGAGAQEVTESDFPRAARGNYCPSAAAVLMRFEKRFEKLMLDFQAKAVI